MSLLLHWLVYPKNLETIQILTDKSQGGPNLSASTSHGWTFKGDQKTMMHKVHYAPLMHILREGC
jgi:hypothetical protein